MLEEVSEKKILITYLYEKDSISLAANFYYAPQLEILLENVKMICHGKSICLELWYVEIAYPRTHVRKINTFQIYSIILTGHKP